MKDFIRVRLARQGILGYSVVKRFDENGVRMTDCCRAVSQHDDDGFLFCSACFDDVEPGEGDGTETKEESR
ncbi:MAG: hypothetical protein GY885_02120 [Phycisphaeraceae bacterium]|nr:hypothetical protein [Phycisphaeraceae bacterium]